MTVTTTSAPVDPEPVAPLLRRIAAATADDAVRLHLSTTANSRPYGGDGSLRVVRDAGPAAPAAGPQGRTA